ncbi:hypothetical protein LUZ60_016073 [Juncus effusus]|nr:hypothetical protein LUZ60_016073 [Juncus effusus]
MDSHNKMENTSRARETSGREMRAVNQGKRPHLSIDIPPKGSMILASPTNSSKPNTLTPPPPSSSSSRSRGGLPPRSPAPCKIQKTKSGLKTLLSGRNLTFLTTGDVVTTGEEGSSVRNRDKDRGFVTRSLSFTKIFSPSVRRASSLPVDAELDLPEKLVHGSSVITADDSSVSQRKEAGQKILRSKSVPLNGKISNNSKGLKRMDSTGGVFRVIPSPRPTTDTSGGTVPEIISLEPENNEEENGEDIAEEEAVCRICLTELSEGDDTTLKLECLCKGELALAHKECAIKWFSIKGNRDCEVCKHEVSNLSVTLLRIQSVRNRRMNITSASVNVSYYGRYSVWQGMPILVTISMLAYFCFLEQLLVADNGTAALAISLPFSCILGLFASLTSTTIVMRQFIWIYATVQFLLVAFFAHLFYTYLHMQAVISIILATFAGFGITMSGNSLIVELLRWRARSMRDRHARTAAQTQHDNTPPAQQHHDEPPHAASSSTHTLENIVIATH